MSRASSCAWWTASLSLSPRESNSSRSRSIWISGTVAPWRWGDQRWWRSLDCARGQPSLEQALQGEVGDDLGDRGEHGGGKDLRLVVAELAHEELRYQGDRLHVG